MLLNDITAPYTAVTSWFYDRFIADRVFGYLVDILDEMLREPAPDTVLDVGCGGGQLVLHLAEQLPGAHVVGVDLSPVMIERARRRVRERAEVIAASALELPFPDGHFAAVISRASIKHWEDQGKGMSELVRVLRPGGLLVVSEADRGCTLDDARSFVTRLGAPRPLREPALMLFRTYLAGQSLDFEDARNLLAPYALDHPEVRRLPGIPELLITARKP